MISCTSKVILELIHWLHAWISGSLLYYVFSTARMSAYCSSVFVSITTWDNRKQATYGFGCKSLIRPCSVIDRQITNKDLDIQLINRPCIHMEHIHILVAQTNEWMAGASRAT